MDSNRPQDARNIGNVQKISDYGDDYTEAAFPPAKEPVSAKKRKIRRIVFYVLTVVMALINCRKHDKKE